LSTQVAAKATELAVEFSQAAIAYAEEARRIEDERAMLMDLFTRQP
jgi:hypothetical protein